MYPATGARDQFWVGYPQAGRGFSHVRASRALMPYKSDAQRRFFHTDTARRKGISAADVKEFDSASRGMKLPERARKRSPKGRRSMTGRRR